MPFNVILNLECTLSEKAAKIFLTFIAAQRKNIYFHGTGLHLKETKLQTIRIQDIPCELHQYRIQNLDQPTLMPKVLNYFPSTHRGKDPAITNE